MRPETSNNNSGKSSCAYSNLMQTTILKILNVIIMMRMTYASYMQFFMKMLACYKIWSILSPWRKEMGATATFRLLRQLIEMPMQKKGVDVWDMLEMVG